MVAGVRADRTGSSTQRGLTSEGRAQIFPDLYSKLLKAMLPLMAADCADAEAAVVRELQQSKHAAERAMIGADNFDDDDAAAPVGATKAISDRARMSGGQRAQQTRGAKKSAPDAKPLASEGQAEQDTDPLRPRGPGLEVPVGDPLASDAVLGEGKLGSDSVGTTAAATLPGMCAVAVGGMAVGLVAGMVLARR